jgi:hypothetical protein
VELAKRIILAQEWHEFDELTNGFKSHLVARVCFRDGEALVSLVASVMYGFL